MNERIESIYADIEANMLNYEDYKDIPVQPVGEKLVPIIGTASLSTTVIRDDARPVTGDKTYVREGVYERLQEAGASLFASNRLTLDVGYGYRSLDVQQKRFEEALRRVPADIPEDQRFAIAHRQVAVPEVAGHPAGAAVDVRLLWCGIPIDCGTELWGYRLGYSARRIYYGSPDVSALATENRTVLREAMMSAGFAPFDGEWWHFSYGDKEWAKYYNKPAALYGQIEFRAPTV